MNNSGQAVNDETAIKVSAFYSCLRGISEDVAKVGFNVYKIDQEGNKTWVNHPARYLLSKMPSNVCTPFMWRSTMVKNALLYGNGYSYIERFADSGKPKALYLINPKYVIVQLVNQTLYYSVNDPDNGIYGTFNENDIFHIKGLGDGYVGKSVLQYGAESIGGALAVQTYAASFFGTGATLGGYLEIPGVIKDENTAKSIKESFLGSYKTQNGANNGIGLLSSGAKFQKFTAQPNEAQMVEAREFSVADIARWFRYPLSKLQAGSTGSSNLEQLNIEYVTDCLLPWFTRLEQEVERKLFRYDEMENYDARFSLAELMRGDMTSTSNYIKTLFYSGMINRNEGRRMIDLNTITESFGNYFYTPANMVPSELEQGFWESKDNSKKSQSNPGDGGQN